MAFKALLLSKDAELVQTLARLLKDLDIAVESCSEPFAAAKRLMDQHFDAILVDCEEEQGAGWVLQSARMATASKKSITIAIVGPQTASRGGPRTGENFTIQKPIVLKQVESTLRAARGLMGDAALPHSEAPATGSGPAVSSTSVPKPLSPAMNLPAPGASTAQGRPPAELFDELSAALDRLGPKAQPAAQPVPLASSAPSGAAAAAAPAFEKPAPMPPQPAPYKEAPSEPVLRPAPPEPVLRKEPLVEAGLRPAPQSWTVPPSATPKPEVANVLPLAATSAEMRPAARPAEEQVRSNNALDDVRRRMNAAPPPAWRTEARERQEVPAPRFSSLVEDEEPRGKFPFKGIAVAMVLVSLALFAYSWYRGRNDAGTPATAAPVATSQPPVAEAPGSPAPAEATPANSQSSDLASETVDNSSTAAEPAPATQPAKLSNSARPAKAAPETTAADTTTDLEMPPAPLVVGGGQRQKRSSTSQSEAQLAPPSLDSVANAPKSGLGGVVNSGPVALPKLAAAATAPQRIRVSQGVTQGLLIHQVKPQYPQLARESRVQGDVVLEAVIGQDGTVHDVHVISGPSMLVGAAADAVRQWRYKPYLLNGQPVEVETQIKLEFRL